MAICLSLCLQGGKLVEENVNSQLREKQGEKMLRMQRNDEAVFDELFSFACPKFITLSPPNYEELVNYNQDAYRLQLKLFLSEHKRPTSLQDAVDDTGFVDLTVAGSDIVAEYTSDSEVIFASCIALDFLTSEDNALPLHWLLDRDATFHVTPYRDWFSSYSSSAMRGIALDFLTSEDNASVVFNDVGEVKLRYYF
ncbi:hypothetical protein L7F22_045674 [Adiantum nelumboides]|nr:hypothetical protein [Adiantum nelumboides]